MHSQLVDQFLLALELEEEGLEEETDSDALLQTLKQQLNERSAYLEAQKRIEKGVWVGEEGIVEPDERPFPLPSFLTQRVFSFCTAPELAGLSRVNSTMKEASEADVVWKQHCSEAVTLSWPQRVHCRPEVHTLKEQFASLVGHSLYGFGNSEFGQLALGDAEKRMIFKVRGKFLEATSHMEISPIAHPVVAKSVLLTVSCGAAHCAALALGGRIIVWGSNIVGQLGIGDRQEHRQPTLLELPGKAMAVLVACGGYHTITHAVHAVDAVGPGEINTERSSKRSLVVWGDNRHGQCGALNPPAHYTDGPQLVRPYPLPNFRHAVQQIACGSSHTVLLLQGDEHNGQVVTFGRNSYGQLAKYYCEPAPIMAAAKPALPPLQSTTFSQCNTDGTGAGMDVSRSTAMVYTQLRSIVHIAAGSEHTAVVDHEGRLFMCGRNDFGQCGMCVSLRDQLAQLQQHLRRQDQQLPPAVGGSRGRGLGVGGVGVENGIDAAQGEDGSEGATYNEVASASQAWHWWRIRMGKKFNSTSQIIMRHVPVHLAQPKPTSIAMAEDAAGIYRERVKEKKSHTGAKLARVSTVGCGSTHTIVLACGGTVHGMGSTTHGQTGEGRTVLWIHMR
jgi:alpha-tubulin suppressor-like RCC1 family protein